MRPARLTALAAIAALLAPAALAAAPASPPPDDTPDFHLDLDTGGHRAAVRDLAVTPDGETLVSASEDKTIRVWDWRAGVTVRTIRSQIGDGNEGKVYAVAVAPDGQTVAAGGYFGPGLGDKPPYGDVRLFDIGSGRMTGVLKGLDYAVYGLDFSPDGALLAAGGEDGMVRVWQKPGKAGGEWTARAPLDADSWRIERVRFALGGKRIVAVTGDNGVRLWDADGTAIDMPEAEELRDVPLQGLAVSPDGTRFATAASDGRLEVWDAADGRLVRALPNPGFSASAIAFASGGRQIVVNCGYRCADRNRSLVLDIESGVVAAEYRGHDGSVTAALPLPDGKTIATAGGTGNEIHLWEIASGAGTKVLKGVGRPVTAVAIDAAAGLIAWGNDNPCPAEIACPEARGALTRQLLLPNAERSFEKPADAGEAAAKLRRAVPEAGEWAIHAGPGGDYGFENAVLAIRRDGAPVKEIENDAETGFTHSAYTLLATAPELVTGAADGTLIAYRREDGGFAGEFLGGHTGAVEAMAEAPKAKYLLTGGADQTLRLWNLATRELIVSMFFTDEDWIMWTPQGYFHSSPNGDRLIGWQVNQGSGKEARFVRAQQLREHLNSPEIVRRAIIMGSAEKAAGELRGTDRQLFELLRRKPPDFSVKLAEGVTAPDGYVAVEITGAAEAGTDVSQFTVLSNERRIDQFAARAAGGDKVIIEVPVEEGQNEILVTGFNEYGYLTERGVTALAKKRAPAEEKKGKLYAVVIGVEDYPLLPTQCNGRSCNLDYPVDDAAEFLRVLAERTAPLFSGMESLVFVNADALDADPDRAAAVEKLAGKRGILDPDSRTIDDEMIDFLDQPGPDDTTIIFVAGHGINIDEDYYFIPTDGRMQDEERWRRSSLVDWRDIQEAVERAKGRRIMVLDTCHAANAFNPRLEKDAADARIIVFSATAANNTAAELPELGHGVFTYSMLEGLKGQANTGGDGVRLLGLADFVYREVVRLSKNRQEPYYHIAQTANFLLAKP